MAKGEKRNNASPEKEITFTRADVYRGATSKYRRKRPGSSMMALVLCAVLFIAVVAASVVHIAKMERPEKSKQESIAEQFASENATPPTTPLDFFDEVTMTEEDVHRGDVILVNYEYPYVFPETEDHLVEVYTNKSQNCSVAYMTYMLDADMLKRFNGLVDELVSVTSDSSMVINSAYRTLEEQQQIWDDYMVKYGEEFTEKYVANPGYSEHHTGICLDLTTLYAVMEEWEHLDTFKTLAVKHGFVQRYMDNKYNFTKINTEPWHYRYVGVPHAYVMSRQNFCLEEYIEYLRDYTSEGDILTLDSEGTIGKCEMATMPENSYVIYFVPASEKGDTSVPVPKNASEYSISGNNVDGFIVSALLGEVELPEIVSGVVGSGVVQ